MEASNSFGLIHFIHGKESGPNGRKFAAMAQVAQRRGWQTVSLDYSRTTDPARRLLQLLAAQRIHDGPLVLVGSSMGGWVATEAASHLDARGVFLLAPALGMAGYPTMGTAFPSALTEIVHGWDDNIIPVQHSITFAQAHAISLHVIQGNHQLDQQIPMICDLFDHFLARLTAGGN